MAHDAEFSIQVHRKRGEYRIVRRDPSAALRFPELRRLAEALMDVSEREMMRLASMSEDRLRWATEEADVAERKQEGDVDPFLGGSSGG